MTHAEDLARDRAEDLPLDGVRVLDLSQFLAGPVCALRLADLGAEVVKVERPDGGDLCRGLVVADQRLGDDSLLFATINRNKRSVAANLKDPADLERVRSLVAEADVLLHNFRPGVMERLGLGHERVREINETLVYGVVSGYGTEGPWRDKPGQDLLVQARSGLVWLTGGRDHPPIPTGVSIADIAAGMHLAQGVLAALFRRATRGRGALVEVSLLASAMDLQFEQYTSWLNADGAPPERSAVAGANVHAAAPYGLYRTADGWIAIAMAPVAALREALGLEALAPWEDPALAFVERDAIKRVLRAALVERPSAHWLSRLEPAGLWAAEVLDWRTLGASGALDALDLVQRVGAGTPTDFRTTACPIRIDGATLRSAAPPPALGAHTHAPFPPR